MRSFEIWIRHAVEREIGHGQFAIEHASFSREEDTSKYQTYSQHTSTLKVKSFKEIRNATPSPDITCLNT